MSEAKKKMRKKTVSTTTTIKTASPTTQEEPKTTKKTAKKVVKKKVVGKKKESTFTLNDIMGELAEFQIQVMSKDSNLDDAPYRIPFKNKALQKATGGIIGGKMIEISGVSQAGKSFLLYELLAECQKMGGYGLLTDGERAFEDAYAGMVGIDLKAGSFAISNEIDMDKHFKIMVKFMKGVRAKNKTAPILLGTDSFPLLQCNVDLANMEAGKDPRGYMAMQKNAKFSQWVEKIIPMLDKYDATFVLLNQVRKDHTVKFGDPWKSLCEDVIAFHCTQRLRGKAIGKITRKGKSINQSSGKTLQIGSKSEWNSIKNRAVKPFQKVQIDILYAKGINEYSGLDELLVNDDLIKVASSSVGANGEKLSKQIKGFKLIDKDSKFYPTIKELVDENPHVLEPIWTGSYDDGDEYEVENYEEENAESSDDE